MSRIPKIVILMIAVTAIFLWVSTLFNSCGTKSDEMLSDTQEYVDSSDDFLSDDEDIFSDDYNTDPIVEDDAEEESEFVSADAPTEEVEEDYTTGVTTYSSSNSTSKTSGGSYFLIAGNYLVKTNANDMVRKLENLGYSSEIAVFERSQYHTVIAGRYDSYSTAQSSSNNLNRQGIDCYVKKKEL